MPQTIRSEFHTALASVLTSDVQLLKANYYYYLGRVDPWATADIPANLPPILSQKEDDAIRDNIVYMKKITPNDISLVVKRYDWATGVVFDRWNSDVVMTDKKFYVVNSENRVYKCLNNNDGAASTVEPTAVNYGVFLNADGYLWKYMFTVPAFKWAKFSSPSHIPVQKAVSDSFYNRGSIEEVVVANGGSGYTTTVPTAVNITSTTTGSGALIALVVNGIGAITGVTISNGGTLYTKGARISITTTTGSGAILTPVIVAGVVTGVTITAAGIGYSALNSAAVYVGGAILRAVLSSVGSLIDIVIIDTGIGYTAPPVLSIVDTKPVPTGVGLYTGNATALATTIVNNGAIARILISDPGINYPREPNTLNVSGDGSGAICVPIIYNGAVIGVRVETAGTGYSYATLTVTGSGTGALLTANLGKNDYISDQSIVEQTAIAGAIYAVNISGAGQNYTTTTIVTITGDGTGATATATVVSGGITKIKMTAYGTGYSYAAIAITDVNRVSGPGVPTAAATIIQGPIMGHGFNAIHELRAGTVAISSILSTDAALKALTQDYRQYGVIRNPTDAVLGTFIKLDSELICFKVSFGSTTNMVKDEILINNGYRYRVVSFDSSIVFLQPLTKKYVYPNTALNITSEDNTRSYSMSNIISYPTINKYSGSLMLLSNEPPFQFTTEQSLAIKTYIGL